MNTTLTASPPELREALYSLSMAKDVPDAALLDDFVRRFPQFGGELTNFAIAIAIDALHGDAVVEAAEAAQIGRASCRERVCQYVWMSVFDVPFKKQKKTNTE